MKIISTIIVLLGCCILQSQARQASVAGKHYIIKGTVKGMKKGTLCLFSMRSDKSYTAADTAVFTNGTFTFEGAVATPELCLIKPVGNKPIPMGSNTFFMLEGGILYVEYRPKEQESTKAFGQPLQDQFYQFNLEYYALQKKWLNSWGAHQMALSQKNQAKADRMAVELASYAKQKEEVIRSFVTAHPASLIAAYIINQHLCAPAADAAVIEPLYNQLSDEVKQSKSGKQVYAALNAAKTTAIGIAIPAFSVPDKNGELVNIAGYKGKYILIDFWASWCGPCRRENPNLLKAYKQYKDKGFDILSVSIDENKDKWLAAVAEDQLSWTQVSDLKGKNSTVYKQFEIRAIPMNYLLDTEGRIVAKNLRGEELQKKLTEIIK
jgi:thiol-disulfide isomerase/thioredoxin